MADYGIWIIIAYLMGSISSAIVVCKLLSLPDPRKAGSGNPGATNVARLAGKKIAAIVLFADALKGFIPVYFVHVMFNQPFLSALTLLAAFLGHVYPIFFRFQGGKGVATTWGGLLGLSWVLGGIFAGTWVLTLIVSRYSSLAALVAMTVATFAACLFYGFIISGPIIVVYLIILWRHKANITRLLGGTETKT